MKRFVFVLSLTFASCFFGGTDKMGACPDRDWNGYCDVTQSNGGSGGTVSTGGTAGSAGATSSSSIGGTGGTTTSSGGSGGSGGEVITGGTGGTVSSGGGGSGGTVTTGGSGGSPPTIVLEWTFSPHPPNVYLGIAGIVDFPAPTPDIDPVGRSILQPSCLASQSTDTVVTCDVGVAESGTVLHIDLNSYDSGGNFIYYHCDDPAVVGQSVAKCEGTLKVTVGGSLLATCAGADPLASPCTAEVNSETGRRRYIVTVP